MTPSSSSNTSGKRNGSYDWTKWISLAWAVLLVAGTGLYHAGGRLASPTERRIEVREIISQYVEDIRDLRTEVRTLKERVRSHEQSDNNDVIMERVKSLDSRISHIEALMPYSGN